MHPERIGPYVIDKKIGSGGMGAVYLGRHETTGDVVAVKVLPASLAREEGFVQRFNREIEAMQKVSSPYIVKLFESGVDGETYYYSMEYVDGETLTACLRRDRKIEWPQAVEIALQICLALKAAHDAGVIHRDLKPSNLLLATDGTCKLTDFGVAQVFATNRLTVTGGVIGTAEYMSPEQAQGHRATKRSDLYSLGAVLYVMLTGRPPFTGTTTVEILQKHRYGQFDRVARYVPDIPRWLDELVSQLLEKAPEKRPPDALVLSRQLREALRRSSEQDVGETLVSVAGMDEGETQSLAADGGFGPTFMRDMVRAEIEQATAQTPLQKLADNTWVLVTALMLLIATPVAVYRWTSSLTDDEKFERGVALMDESPGSNWIAARDQYFLPLIESDAPTWTPRVRPYLDDVEAYEMERELLKRRRRNATPQDEFERLLLGIRAAWEAGDLRGAERDLHAAKVVAAVDQERSRFAPLIDRWLQQLAEELPDNQQLSEFLARQQAVIAKEHQQRPEVAEQLREALLILYRDDPAALEKLSAPSNE